LRKKTNSDFVKKKCEKNSHFLQNLCILSISLYKYRKKGKKNIMNVDLLLRRLTWVLYTLPTWLPIACKMSKIANQNPFLEAQFKKRRFSNATLVGSTIHRGKGL
jgi:hypothetical protein